MARWHGLQPTIPAVSVQSTATDYSPTSTDLDGNGDTNPWRNDDGTGLRWWSTEGVDAHARHCTPANIAQHRCDPENPDPECLVCAAPLKPCPVGGYLNFQYFTVDKTLAGCNHPINGVDYGRIVEQELDVDQWVQVGRAIVEQKNGLADTSVDGNPGAIADARSGLGHLSNIYSTLGFGIAGTIVMPWHAAEHYLADGELVREGGRVTTAGGMPVVTGPGISNVGPGHLQAPPGHAWIYITGQRPIVAVHPKTMPTLSGRQIGDYPAAWFDGICFAPTARRWAIAVTAACQNYAVLVDLRSCNGCDPSEFPTETTAPLFEV